MILFFFFLEKVCKWIEVLAQLVEHRTVYAKVTGAGPVHLAIFYEWLKRGE